jgi:hypothetical protein
MKIDYDTIQGYAQPELLLLNPGYTNDARGPMTGVLGLLAEAGDIEFEWQMGTPTVLSFTFNRTFSRALYEKLEHLRYIYAAGYGYFQIQNVTEDIQGGAIFIKNVSASSMARDLQQKAVPMLETEDANADDEAALAEKYSIQELLDIIISAAPKWAVGTISGDFHDRIFESVDDGADLLSFLMDDVQSAYECVVEFDTINRLVNVKSRDNFFKPTDVFLAYDTLVESVQVERDASELTTALFVKGANEETDIFGVNPMGTNVIYNFSYYLPWMDEATRTAVSRWQTDIAAAEDGYAAVMKQHTAAVKSLSNAVSETVRWKKEDEIWAMCYTSLQTELAKDEEEKSDELLRIFNEYNKAIEDNGGEPLEDVKEFAPNLIDLIKERQKNAAVSMEIAQIAKTVAQSQVDNFFTQAQAIRDNLNLKNRLTAAQWEELSVFIKQSEYADEHIGIEEKMTDVEAWQMCLDLYAKAKETLAKAAAPTEKFSIRTNSALFASEFSRIAAQLEPGCVVYVEHDETDTAALFLQGMTVNYTDTNTTFTFSNRYNKYDAQTLFEEVFGNITRMSNTLSYINSEIKPLNSGVKAMKEQIRAMRELAKRELLAAADQSVVIDDTGYYGRKKDETDGTGFSTEELRIINNMIAFSDDHFDTVKLALGKIPNGFDESGNILYRYGMNAEVLQGEIILGSQLQIGVADEGKQKNLLALIDDKSKNGNTFLYAEEGDGGGLFIGGNATDGEDGTNAVLRLDADNLDFFKGKEKTFSVEASTSEMFVDHGNFRHCVRIGTTRDADGKTADTPIHQWTKVDGGLALICTKGKEIGV